jgi:hypothetical protein
LIHFLESGEGMVNDVECRAKRGVPVALGYLLNQTRDQEVFTYLQQSVQTADWERRRLHWTCSALPTKAARNNYLTRKSILALGLAGTNAANAALSSHHCAQDVRCSFRDTMTESLDLNRKLRDQRSQPSLKWYLDQTSATPPAAH